MPPGCFYLEKLVVGGGLREAAAVLDGLLELGGLGDHVCGSFGGSCWVVDPLWCGLFGWDCWREELNSGMPDDVICTPPSRYSSSWDLDRGVDHLHRNDALGITCISPTSHQSIMWWWHSTKTYHEYRLFKDM